VSVAPNHRVIIIDDNPDIHADFEKILAPRKPESARLEDLELKLLGKTAAQSQTGGYELAFAHQGQEGFEKIREANAAGKPFFVAFVDMRMPPGWDGLKTIEEIRKVDNDISIVVCTAYTDHSWEKIAEQVRSLDKLLILKKPFDPVEVQSMAQSLSERWGLLKQAKLRTDELEQLVTVRTQELEAERAKDKLRMEELEVIVAERTAELRNLAMNDKLTGLPNRVQFYDRLLSAISRAQREPGYQYAVMFIDFDRFKVINDSLGHDAGDRLLTSISERLQLVVTSPALVARASTPLALAARLGGDEFCILLEGFADESVVLDTANRALQVLARPYDLGGRQVSSSASIGITLSRFGYRNAETVLRDADTAMYAAKARGRGSVMVFDAAMHERAMRRLVLENDLRHAIDREELAVWYQPIVSLENRRPVGMEALLRWKHPVHGMISPIDFIPLAEETGLIVPIGEWVMEQAALQVAHFPDLNYVSVNVARRQLVDPAFLASAENVFRRHPAVAGRIVLEVTESALIDDTELARQAINTLRKTGLKVYLDDFGTGLSSLGSLRQFELDGIKMDWSFLDHGVFTRRTAAVIHSTMMLARNLDMDLVAEGVEALEQVAMLQSLQCSSAQGYLFSKPVPLHDLPSCLGGMIPPMKAVA
jgi:diguanylate cyclase (GGDEF)-like protein